MDKLKKQDSANSYENFTEALLSTLFLVENYGFTKQFQMQPVKKSGPFQKPRSKTVRKKAKPKDASASKPVDKRLPPKKNPRKFKYIRPRFQKYGTSKLEERFAHDFLDVLGVDYIYQFEAKSIGRYFDFYIPKSNVLIEVDGDFYHSYGLVYEQMSPMQKKNKRVDEAKNHWALVNGIKLIRIWEHDINDHREAVMAMLKRELEHSMRKNENKELKNRTHRRIKNEDDD